MAHLPRTERRRLLAERGVSRRDFGRMAALLAAGAALPFYNEAALAQDLRNFINIPPDAVRLNANENPMGPCPEAAEAVHKLVAQGGRYLFQETIVFIDAMAAVEGLPPRYVFPCAGSSEALHRAVIAFTSPERPLVLAEPGYEAPAKGALFLGAKVIKVPLRPDHSHDAQAMARAHPSTGLIYICNPNNPTGTVTRPEDIDYLVANKPKGCVVLVDEAYIHFSATAVPCVPLVAADKDVVVLRTFSKLYGMAGLRAGAALARPDLVEKLRGNVLNIMPTTGMAAATASLKVKDLVPRRRKLLADIRADLFDWLEKKSYSFIPSDVNMVMIDGKRPGAEMLKAMLERKVAVGRPWPCMPTHVRVSIGTRDEMARFKTAFERVMEA